MRKFVGAKPRAVAHATYLKSGRKYGISATGKSYEQLAQVIYNFELRTTVRNGLYFKPA